MSSVSTATYKENSVLIVSFKTGSDISWHTSLDLKLEVFCYKY